MEAGLAIWNRSLICKAVRGEYKGSGKQQLARRTGGGVFTGCFWPSSSFVIVLIITARLFRKLGRLAMDYSSRGRWACVYPGAAVAGRPGGKMTVEEDSAGSVAARCSLGRAARDRAGDQTRTREFLAPTRGTFGSFRLDSRS